MLGTIGGVAAAFGVVGCCWWFLFAAKRPDSREKKKRRVTPEDFRAVIGSQVSSTDTDSMSS